VGVAVALAVLLGPTAYVVWLYAARPDRGPVLRLADLTSASERVMARTPGLVLDSSGYRWPGQGLPGFQAPDAVSLVMRDAASEYAYIAPFDPERRRHRIDAAVLRPLPGAPPFPGFVGGRHYRLRVGRSAEPGVDGWGVGLQIE
jgi:hypothetical protein